MAYCRIGINSNIYCYLSCENLFVVNIAKKKCVNAKEAPVFGFHIGNPLAYVQYQAYTAWVKEHAIWEDICLPYAGETLFFEDKDECLTFLSHLRDLGYMFTHDVECSILNEDYAQEEQND